MNRCYQAAIVATLCLFFVSEILAANAPAGSDQRRTLLGLGPRPAWTASRVKGLPQPPYRFSYENAFPGIGFDQPVVLTNAPGTSRFFVAEVKGKIYSFENRRDVDQVDLLIDIRQHIPSLQQLYGITFHPNFPDTPYLYACVISKSGLPDGTKITRFTVENSDPPVADPASAKVVYEWLSGGHNGCAIKFGHDGYLYISTGDGVGPNPPDTKRAGQDVSNVLCSILRIDVDHEENGRPFAIPPDNPFVDLEGAKGEVWCYGFRNPWKISVDRETGDIWAADVGWEAWEMVYRVERGGNYGWSIMEGPQPVHPGEKRGPTPILPPVKAHDHFEARSITGGFVYRGKKFPELLGAYLYGDYSTGKMWGLRYDGERVTWEEELVDTATAIVGYGEDNDGELYFLDYKEHGDGKIYQIIPNLDEDTSAQFPRKLSDTGLFETTADHVLAAGVVPYAVNAPLWHDHSVATRFLALPGNGQLDGSPGAWGAYPEGTVIGRTVSIDLRAGDPHSSRRLETQIFHFENDDWLPYTYVWNEEQTDAELADVGGAELDLTIVTAAGEEKRTWHVSSRAECSMCHTDKVGSVLGVSPEQLDRPYDYGYGPENQLEAWRTMGMFTKPDENAARKRSLVDPYDRAAKLDDRARSYLHANCRHCHRPGGGGTSMIHLNYLLTLRENNVINALPTQGKFELAGTEILTPGDPYASVLFYRMWKLGRGRMPHMGSEIPDERGLDLIHDWIARSALPPMKNEQDKPAKTRAWSETQAELTAVLERLRQAADMKPEARSLIVSRLLGTTRSAFMVSRLMAREKVPDVVYAEVAKQGAKTVNVNVRDLFERFLPPEQRTQRLGEEIDPAAILSLRGDVERGRRAFLYGAASACKNCHRAQESGGVLGPDLSGIGKKYKPAELLETIVNPSKAVEDKYRPYLVVSTSGAIVTGLLVQKNADAVVIKNAENKVVRIPADEVAQFAPQKKSIMPEQLLRDLTAQEAADLLAFLGSLQAETEADKGGD